MDGIEKNHIDTMRTGGFAVGLTPWPFGFCGHDRRSGGGFDKGSILQDRLALPVPGVYLDNGKFTWL
jgi:hypothetical protein